jgi:hypothetical protein
MDPNSLPHSDFNDTHVKLGISRAFAEVFHVGGYRYSALADAVAQARRMGNNA